MSTAGRTASDDNRSVDVDVPVNVGTRRGGRGAALGPIGGVLLLTLVPPAAPALAVTHLKYGMDAPIVALVDLNGRSVSTDTLKGKTLVLVFGELYHERTKLACGEIQKTLDTEAFGNKPVATMLVVSQQVGVDDLRKLAREWTFPATILRDAERQAFETYRVTVLPSVVVIDSKGKVVHAFAAYTSRFADTFKNAMALAVGDIDRAAFEKRLHPPANEETDAKRVRAQRLSELARQLARRRLSELAVQKYNEAIELAPDYVPAHLGLGVLELNQRHLPEAERHFNAVLSVEPKSIEASLGLAFLMTLRGDKELDTADRLVRGVLAEKPDEPQAHYLMGRIHEQRGEKDAATASFKKAAELFMEREQLESAP
jgi:Tfp pilus assembly protein PilF/peroxiredoxin